MSEVRRTVPDPVAGTIELPIWFLKIKDIPAVRRMLFIKQLGLKAYVDFPGAVHTRYSHALGTMHLAGKVADLLHARLDGKNKEAADAIEGNRENLMAAGFLHDIGHGPFSHTVDFVLQQIANKTHEQMARSIIEKEIPPNIDSGGKINKKSVLQILCKEHEFPFLYEIIDGPLDVDKLDYLLRDAYHVGYRYSFDLDHFLSNYEVLGDLQDLKNCGLGLENTHEAIVTAEIFLVIWKSMYDIVYFKQNSRIAEKMLEKIILLNRDDKEIKNAFGKGFLDLHDEVLLGILKEIGGKTEKFVENIRNNNLYRLLPFEITLDATQFKEKDPDFFKKIQVTDSIASDNLSKLLGKQIGLDEYAIICDIITSRKPKTIHLEKKPRAKENEKLEDRSPVVQSVGLRSVLRVYKDPSVSTKFSEEEIEVKLKGLVQNCSDELFVSKH